MCHSSWIANTEELLWLCKGNKLTTTKGLFICLLGGKQVLKFGMVDRIADGVTYTLLMEWHIRLCSPTSWNLVTVAFITNQIAGDTVPDLAALCCLYYNIQKNFVCNLNTLKYDSLNKSDPHIQYWKWFWSKSGPCLTQCWPQCSLDQFSLFTVADLTCASIPGLAYCAKRHWGRSALLRLRPNFTRFQVILYFAIIYYIIYVHAVGWSFT